MNDTHGGAGDVRGDRGGGGNGGGEWSAAHFEE